MRLRTLLAVAAAFGLTAIGTSAQAGLLVQLNAGGTVTPTLVSAANLTADFGAVVATNATILSPNGVALNAGTYNGYLLEEVRIKNGTVTFDFKVTNGPPVINPPDYPTGDIIGRITPSSFAGTATYVGTTDSSGPDTAYRTTGAGPVVGFNISVAPNTSSGYLIIQTSASAYNTLGHVGVSDGSTLNLTGYAPVVPEPGTAVLSALSLGLVGLGTAGYRRFRAAK